MGVKSVGMLGEETERLREVGVACCGIRLMMAAREKQEPIKKVNLTDQKGKLSLST